MKDTFGNLIVEGGYLISSGRGNLKAEYGMILYKVLSIKDKTPKVIRLDVDYSNKSPKIVTSISSLQNLNKYLQIEPPQHIIDLFEKGLNGTCDKKESALIAKWIHGKDYSI